MTGHLDFKVDRDELSERLGGGLPRGSLIVIEAPYGTGKSILTQRILYGLLKNHHSAGVVSTELTTLGFIEQMRSLDYGIESQLLAGDLLFLPVYPLVAQRQLPKDLLARLRDAEPLYQKEAIIIDTFSKLITEQRRAYEEEAAQAIHTPSGSNGHQTLLLENAADPHDRSAPSGKAPTSPVPETSPGGMETERTGTGPSGPEGTRPGPEVTRLDPGQRLTAQIEDTLYHIKRRTSSGKTIVLTVEPDQLPDNVLQLLRDTSDVHFTLEFSLVGNNASRRIVVKRFSRAKGRLGDVIGYRVEPGVGLVIEIKSVA